jgi:hypothetical protein
MPESFAFFIRVLNPTKDGFEDSKNLSEGVLEQVCKNFKMKLLSAADFERTGRISDQVLLGIREADIVFADANTCNENVWYEIGYTHCINPYKLIFLFKEGKALPFDIADYRGLSYRNDFISLRELENNLSAMVSKVLSHTHLERLLRLEYWDTAALEYIGTLPDLRSDFIDYLKDTACNIDLSAEMRKRALWVLLSLGFINTEICERFSGQLVGEGLKGILLEALAELDFAAPQMVWENMLSGSPRQPVLASSAKAAACQWIKGYIETDYFMEHFVSHKQWIVGKHLSISLLENISPKTIEVLTILANNKKPEVYKRFVEWIDGLKEKGEPLSTDEVSLLVSIKETWTSWETGIKKEKCDDIRDLLCSLPSESIWGM